MTAGPQLSDLNSAQRCWDSYWAPQFFDRIFRGEADDEVWLGIKFNTDCVSLTFRGSTDAADWFRDFEAQMVDDPILGGVHFGFLQGLRPLLDTIRPMLATDKRIVVEGHSLGAGRAHLMAALLQREAFIVERVLFGSPRPGGTKLATILNQHPCRSFRNRRDPVCAVPFDIPLFDEYRHPEPQIHLDQAPPPDDSWGPMADHHMPLYLEAVKKCFASA